MATQLKVTSPTGGEITIPEANIKKITYRVETPGNSGARSTKQTDLLIIEGQYVAGIGGSSNEPVQDLQKWSLVSGKSLDAYRKVEVSASNEMFVLRNYIFPKAYVVDFDGGFDSEDGGWKLVVAQKEDQLEYVEINGGYSNAD